VLIVLAVVISHALVLNSVDVPAAALSKLACSPDHAGKSGYFVLNEERSPRHGGINEASQKKLLQDTIMQLSWPEVKQSLNELV
jgi:hypothetical protein